MSTTIKPTETGTAFLTTPVSESADKAARSIAAYRGHRSPGTRTGAQPVEEGWRARSFKH